MKTLKCSFCEKYETEVDKPVAGTGGRGTKPSVYICDKCIETAKNIISDEKTSEPISPLK
jgi:ATP-dependent protease Clp ATPase subunit